MSRSVVLASESAQRRLVLEALGIEFVVQPAYLDESTIKDSNVKRLVKKLALAKAMTVAHLRRPSTPVVLAADSLISIDGQTLGKPATRQEAKRMLRMFSGRWVTEWTGVAVGGFAQDSQLTFWVTSSGNQALFRPLSVVEIDKYVKNNPVTTWAGGFSAAYPTGLALIERIKGSVTGFTHGFPAEVVSRLLSKTLLRQKSILEPGDSSLKSTATSYAPKDALQW